MNQQITLFGDPASISDLAGRAISAVVNGDISPIDAHIQISRMENAIKQFKDDAQVRDITLRELSKYGKSHQFGDCRLEEAESGVKYDYSMCGDSELNDMYKTLEALKADIKERETMLRNLPRSGVVAPETGDLRPAPVRQSSKPPSKSSRHGYFEYRYAELTEGNQRASSASGAIHPRMECNPQT